MRWYYWTLLALVVGFALNVNVVEALVQPIEQIEQDQSNQSTHVILVSMSAEERIADYTWTLDILTGVLAVATIGLLIATAWGVFRQSRETKIVERAYIVVEPRGVIPLPSNNHGGSICPSQLTDLLVGLGFAPLSFVLLPLGWVLLPTKPMKP